MEDRGCVNGLEERSNLPEEWEHEMFFKTT